MYNLLKSLWAATSTYYKSKEQFILYAQYILQVIRQDIYRHYFFGNFHSFHEKYNYKDHTIWAFLGDCNKYPINSEQVELPPTSPDPAPIQYVISVTSDGWRILAIIISIIPDNSSGEMSYNFLMSMDIFIPSQPGSCLTSSTTNSKPTTTILRQKSAPMPLLLPLTPHPRLTIHQRILPLKIQILLPVILPLNIPQAWHLHSHMRSHQRIWPQKNLPHFQILYQYNVQWKPLQFPKNAPGISSE